MKKLIICLSVTAIFACKQKPKNYATVSGKIENKSSDILQIHQGEMFSKKITVAEDGTFSDTLKVNTGIFALYDGKIQVPVYLKNGYDLKIDFDAEKSLETISFSGEGVESNNYLVERSVMQQNLVNPNIFYLEETEFNTKVNSLKKNIIDFIDSKKEVIDTLLYAEEKRNINRFTDGLGAAYAQQQHRLKQFSQFKGKPSPTFKYENVNGGETALSNLKGKYVFIDLWATWCEPCLKEIPALNEIKKTYKNKNIEFVSISVDNGRGYTAQTKEEAATLAKAGWKKMVAEMELSGIQVIADNGLNSKLVKDYNIRGLPRYVLIDTRGNIVNADAPRPSSDNLKEILSSLENL